MAEINMTIFGKLGVGKTTLINDIMGSEVGRTSDQVQDGCTKGVQRYNGNCVKAGMQVSVFDTEGIFGVKDNLGDLIECAAKQLEGQPLHMMCVCISARHVTRADADMMTSIKICAGIVGDRNIEKLVIVFTQAESPELQAKADECFKAVKDAVVQVYEDPNGREKKREQMKSVYELAKGGRLQYCKVSQGKIDGLVELMKVYQKKPPARMEPENWTKDADRAEEEIDGFKVFLQILGSVLETIAGAFIPGLGAVQAAVRRR